MKLSIKKLSQDARGILPHENETDAGLDICALHEVELLPHIPTKIPTGISLQIEDGYFGRMCDKSSIGSLGVAMLGGVIDSGYRGEIIVMMINLTDEPIHFPAGKKIAQIIIQHYEKSELIYVDTLTDSIRGGRGFGSTGE